MEGSRKGKDLAAPEEEQYSLPNEPFSQVSPVNLPLGSTSPFQVWEWQNPYCTMSMTLGDAAGSSSSTPNSHDLLQFANASSSPAQSASGNNLKVENPYLENPVPTNGTGGAVAVAAVEDSAAKTERPQAAEEPNLDRNCNPNSDPRRLRRIMSNRLSAQRSRMRKMQYLANLEMREKALEAQIAALCPQLQSYRNHKLFLILEKRTLNQHMEALVREKLIKDAEIEMNTAEVNMLRELRMIQEQKYQAQMFDWGSGLPLMSNDLISNHYQVAQNEEFTASMSVDLNQQQGRMWTTDVLDEHKQKFTLPNHGGWPRC